MEEEMNLQRYLQLALVAAGGPSRLADDLQINVRTLTGYRQGRSVPTEEIMVDLASMAEQDETLALLHRAKWLAPDETKKFWARGIRRWRKGA